ncbi:MAG: TonB family protein [Candidatus Eremiobacteraeota bacterium]|nr:TonB family protein [Candidatus Eremiobacteraeota bacterium]
MIRPIHSVEAAPEQQPSQIHIIVIHTPPPPTPTPAATKPPSAKSPPQNRLQTDFAPPRVDSHGARGPSEPALRGIASDATPEPVGPVASTAPETLEPTPTPKPACSVPNASAATINVVSPSVPDEAGTDVDAQAQVRVTLQPDGTVEAVQIYRTAGNVLLDREALRAARESTYRAEIRNCIAVRGDYLFTVDFKE